MPDRALTHRDLLGSPGQVSLVAWCEKGQRLMALFFFFFFLHGTGD
jgi:hypothetical protein